MRTGSLLQNRIEEKREKVTFLLEGDEQQVAEQEDFLHRKGIQVGRVNNYPGFYTEHDFQHALTLIWEEKILGWWHYKKRYIQFSVCSAEDFEAARTTAK